MVKLYHIALTDASRPVLCKSEIERAILDKVDLLFEGVGGLESHPSDEYKEGYVVLTNYRLIWMTTRPAEPGYEGAPCALPLGAVAGVDAKRGSLLKHARLKLAVRLNHAGYPVVESRQVERVSTLKLVCRGSGLDPWRQQLEAALARAAWSALPPGAWQELLAPPSVPSSLAPAGIGSQAGGAGSSAASGSQQAHAAHAAQQGEVFRPDPLMLHELCTMGFLTQRAVNSLLATNNAGTQQAIEWLLEHEGSPLLDMPTAYTTGPSPQQQLQPGPPGSQHALEGLPPGPSTVAQAAAAVQRQLSLGSVGLAGVLKREEQRAAATEHSLDQAFRDLQQLMAKAQEMVQLAEYFRERMQARRAAGGAGGEAGAAGDEELDADTALDLVNLGIVSPVTRETAGSLYHQELSRQLADFLQGPVQRAGGMMPLPDVYCLFNRARGTELVSPDDLLQARGLGLGFRAVKLLGNVPRAGLHLREYASGVKVVQADSHSDEHVCAALAAMVQPPAGASTAGAEGGLDTAAGSSSAATAAAAAAAADTGEALWRATLGPAITQTEVAEALRVPVAVAAEHLLTAEARGVLCRDDGGPEGLRFFRNFFAAEPLPAGRAA